MSYIKTLLVFLGRSSPRTTLSQAVIDSNSIPGLDDLFHQEEVGRPFLGLETQHQQLSFYKTHLNLLVSNMAVSMLNVYSINVCIHVFVCLHLS